MRLWNLKTRELLITLFHGRDGEWVIWTPQGYYAASGPGAELIGWQINHRPDHEAEYINAAQLRKSLNRPDIVAKAIQLGSAEQAVKEAYGTNLKLADLLGKPVPRFRIVSPAANAPLTGGKTEVEIALDATPDPVKLIRIQVNGQQIAGHLPEQGSGFKPGALGPTRFSMASAKMVASAPEKRRSFDCSCCPSGMCPGTEGVAPWRSRSPPGRRTKARCLRAGSRLRAGAPCRSAGIDNSAPHYQKSFQTHKQNPSRQSAPTVAERR